MPEIVKIILELFLLAHIPQCIFCARERKRVCQEGFWDWQDWIPFWNLIHLSIKTGASLLLLIGQGLLVIGGVVSYYFSLQDEVMISAIALGAGALFYLVLGYVFMHPYICTVTPHLTDRMFFSLVSPLGMLYYVLFIKGRKEKPKKKLKERATDLKNVTAGDIIGKMFPGTFDGALNRSEKVPKEENNKNDAAGNEDTGTDTETGSEGLEEAAAQREPEGGGSQSEAGEDEA